ncbi:MAG: endonuclease/exonuclease/phosphatase family protein [Calditrichaeota bacterium]|nr:endonuclease/exonuclease/phosphatase family protein [Calditrichota bacterium]
MYFIRILITVLTLFFIASSSLSQSIENPLTIMTFNIQMTDDYYVQNKKYMVRDIIRNNNVDIIGIQEFQIDAVRDLQKLLPEYTWFGVGRDDGKIAGEMGPVFYNNEKFELLEEKTFWLSEWPDVPGSKSWNTQDTRMATWGRFRVIENGEIFYLFNTHFDHVSVEARENSSRMLLERTSSIAGNKPVIITGDFNFTESSQAYKILIADNPDYVKLYDAKYRSETPSFGPSGTYNGYSNPNPNSKIDFIFVNPFVKIATHGVIDDRPDGVWISDHYPVISQVYFEYPNPPAAPVLKAVAGDGMVSLTWDDSALKNTSEPFNNDINDFEGYKLYRARAIDFSDAALNGDWDIPYMRQPIFLCDLDDDKKGYTTYGIQDGLGYYLGDDTGIQHFYVDTTAQNGVTYYYMITAYDFGISQMGNGFPPLESSYSYETDENGSVKSFSSNVVMVTPGSHSRTFSAPQAKMENQSTTGNAHISVNVVDRNQLKTGNSYKIKFLVDSVSYLRATPQIRHKNDLLFSNKGFVVYNQSENDTIVYSENPQYFSHKNIRTDVHVNAGNIFTDYWYLNNKGVQSDVFDGLQVILSGFPQAFGKYDTLKSGWLNGNAEIGISVNENESVYFPWQYDIVFHDTEFVYTSKTDQKRFIRSGDDEPLVSSSLLLGQTFNFEVLNKSFEDENGAFEQMDLLVHDVNRNGLFEPDSDFVLVGHVVTYSGKAYWAGTVFSIDFHNIKSPDEMPKPGDVYRVDFNRPFIETDSLIFSVTENTKSNPMTSEREIVVVPNPYIVGNAMENPVDGSKRMMFSNMPANGTLTIYSVSGVRVRKINYNNSPDNGSVFWDLRSDQGNSIAPGYYIYRVESDDGYRKTGKFAVIR